MVIPRKRPPGRHRLLPKALCIAAFATAGFLANSRNAEALPSAIASYWDSAHGVENVFYLDNNGVLRDLSFNGSWSVQQVTPLAISADGSTYPKGAFLPGSTLVAFFDGTQGHVFYLADPGGTDGYYGPTFNANNPLLFEEYGNPPNQNNWTDLTDNSAGAYPYFSGFPYMMTDGSYKIPGVSSASTLTGFWDGSVEHVFFIDDNSCVNEIYYNGQWWGHCLNSNGIALGSNGQDLDGMGMTSLWDGTVEHVFYENSGGVQEAYFNGQWWPGSPPSLDGDVLVSDGLSGDEEIYASGVGFGTGVGLDGKNGSGSWWSTSVGDGTSGFCTYGSDAVVYIGPYSLGWGQNYFCVGQDHDVWSVDQNQNVTPMNVPVLVSSTASPQAITGFWDGYCRHVFYIGSDSHVHEQYACNGGGWGSNDLMNATGAPLAAN